MYDYGSVFAAYLARATEKNLFVDRLGGALAQEARPLEILDVGAHDGAVTLRYLEAAGKAIWGSRITALDPSADALGRFRNRGMAGNFAFDFRLGNAETFVPPAGTAYDWVIASHSLYWSRDLPEILNHLRKMGRKMVVVLRDSKGIFQIQSTFHKFLGNPEERLYTADDIANALAGLKIVFRRERVISHIDIPPFEDPAMKVLAAFFLQTAPEKLADSTVAEIRKLMTLDGDRFEHRVSFFWVGE